MMKWPWHKDAGNGVAVIGGNADAIAWLHGAGPLGRGGALLSGGVIERGSDTPAEFARRLRALGLPARATLALLPLQASHLLQIDAPKVAPDELKAAARWHVKDLVDERLEDLTLDVMAVGDERTQGAARHLFVAAARSDAIRKRVELAAAAGIGLTVVDIVETAQRNLQCALADAAGLRARASAALTRQGASALLTICADGELYYARRLEGLDLRAPRPADATLAAAPGPAAQAMQGELPAFVDYGAEPSADPTLHEDTPRLVIELQRSFDVWERTWRDLPLAWLWIELGDDTDAWLQHIAPALGMPVQRLQPESLFPGFDAAAPDSARREALLPLAGALLRSETRSI